MFIFTYIDAIIVDTPIVDAEVRVKIHDVATIDERLDRAQIFLDYLDAEWSKLDESVSSTFDWSAGSAEARRNIQEILQKLDDKRQRENS